LRADDAKAKDVANEGIKNLQTSCQMWDARNAHGPDGYLN